MKSLISSTKLIFIFIFCISLINCSKKSDEAQVTCPAPPALVSACPAGVSLFTQLPSLSTDIRGWVPLGTLNPLSHLFPTDHQYIYVVNPATPVVASGPIVITKVVQASYSATGTTDYRIQFYRCNEVKGEFQHLVSVSAGILASFNGFTQNCQTYSAGTGTLTSCESPAFEFSLNTGDPVGSATFAYDFSLWDIRNPAQTYANPSRFTASCDLFDRFHFAPASNYFSSNLTTTINSKLGSYDGLTQRTIAPLGGRIDVDVTGTAQGYWFNILQLASSAEGPHLALSFDVVDPNQQTISMGSSQPNLFPSGAYKFTPTTSGTVNRNFSQVLPGIINCYEFAGSRIILIKLENSSQLRVEGRQSVANCAAASPYAFTIGNDKVYDR